MVHYPLPRPIIDTLELDKTLLLTVSPEFAKNDLNILLDFLNQYMGNKATFEAYRREIERLLQWTWFVAKKSVLDIKRQDIQEYIEFCLNPPKSWIGTKRVSRYIMRGGVKIPNAKWRPFVATVSKRNFKHGERPDKNNYQLSQKSIREIFTVLGSFYNYLLIDEKITVNPVALIKQKNKYVQKRQQQSSVMRLTENQWQTCLQVVREMADENPKKHERILFILSALYLLYLRISELVSNDRWTPMMKHFYQKADSSWWFKVVGKGNKLREIAVSDDMLSALTRYREKLNLSSLPSPNEKTYLFPKEKGKGEMTDTRHIRRLIQYCFDKTINKLREDKLLSEADAMESATVHWLRHTGISDDINKRGRPIAHVRDDAGHSSSAITDRYNDIELKERYRSARTKNFESEFLEINKRTNKYGNKPHMKEYAMQTVRTILLTFIILTIILITGIIIFVYSGIFDISAQRKENPLLQWLLETTRERSISAHAAEIKVSAILNDPAVIMEGFTHYQEMCVECHRAPGLGNSDISKGLNPAPPNFSRMMDWDLTPAEIFWIIKNGIRMTGMPAWGVTHDDEKIWALTAFVRKLPKMTPSEYQSMSKKVGPKGNIN